VDPFRLLGYLVEAYLWLIMFPMAILSWFRIHPGSTLGQVQRFLFKATDPVLSPVRRIIRPVGSIDISFIVVFFAAQFVLLPILLR
jgi:YggT family protein